MYRVLAARGRLDEWVKDKVRPVGARRRDLRQVAVGRNGGDFHGRTGPVRLRNVPPNDPCAAVLEAAAMVGMPTVAFNRGESSAATAPAVPRSTPARTAPGSSSSHAYLHPILGKHYLDVRRLLGLGDPLRRPNNATGVRYQRPDLTRYDTVAASREVIVTAGAIDLEAAVLSGIGPYAFMSSASRCARTRQSGVRTSMTMRAGVLGGLAAHGAHVDPMVGRSACSPRSIPVSQPDLMMHYGSVPFDMNTLRRLSTTARFCLTPNVTQGHSRGTVLQPRLPGPAEGRPAVLHRSRQLRRYMLTGVKLARKIAEQLPLRAWVARELAPGPDASRTTNCSTTSIAPTTPCTTRRYGAWVLSTTWRFSSAAAGQRACVEGYGSSTPRRCQKLPAVNPNITVMTMAEKCVDLLRTT